MQCYIKITKEKPLVTANGTSTGGYNSGAVVTPAPVLNTDYIWVDYGVQVPAINQVFAKWSHQSVVPNRGVTNRLTGAEQYTIGGQLQTLLFHEQAGFWKAAVLEPTVPTESNPFKVQDLPSYQIDRYMVVNGNAQWTDRVTGCKFMSATVSCSNEGSRAPVALSVSWQGSTRVEIPSSEISAFVPPACGSVGGQVAIPVKPYRWNKSTLTLDSAGASPIVMDKIIRSWTVEIQHQMSSRINKGATVTNMVQTGWTPQMSITVDIDNWDLKTRYQNIINGMDSVKYPKSTLVLLDTVATGLPGNTTFTWIGMVLENLTDNISVSDFSTQNAVLRPNYDCTEWDMKVAYLPAGAADAAADVSAIPADAGAV